MFEACVEVRLEAQVHDDRIVVAIDVGVDSVEALKQLAES